MSKRKRHKPRNLFEINPLTDGQREYLKSIGQNIITFCDGKAGTGKTLLAIGMAMKFFQKETYQHIIVVRPAVEACGENLGFLPGGYEDKMRPYVQPIIDNLRFFIKDEGYITSLFSPEHNVIEISPIAYLRGRTFNNCIIIFDEAQNSTPAQMKLFVTRIGENCKVIVEGDADQSDIHVKNGLADAMERLDGVDNIGCVRLGNKDIVRSQIVADILERY